MKPTTALSLLAALLSAGTASAQLPAYHGNAQHTGYSTARGPLAPVLEWRLDLSGEVISSPVLGPDGTIYLGSVIKDTRHPEHFITAVNPDGTVKWRFGTGWWWDTQTQSSPALGADGRIYVGAQDGYLYALNPNGTLAWRFAAASPVQQHPVVGADGTVYIGMDGRLYAFNPNGAVLWTADLGYSLPGGPALAPDGETIYAFGYNSTGPVSSLYAFRRDGTTRWQYTGFYGYYPALSPPTVAADGTVIVLAGQIVAVGPDGVERWRYEPSASYYSSYASLSVNPAGEVVFAFSWYLGKLSADGTQQWQLDFLGGEYNNELESTYSAPLIDADGNIFLGLGTGKRWTRPWGKVLRAYSPTGNLLWEFPVGEGVYTSSPALAPDGTLYVGSMDGALYALRNPLSTPNTIASLAFEPATVTGGSATQGRVTLRDPAGAGGATVLISPATTPTIDVLSLPASVIVPQGTSSAVFPVGTTPVSSPTPVTICGHYGGASSCAVLTVAPLPGARPHARRAVARVR